MPRRLTEDEREAKFVDRRGPTECWPWTGALTKAGYGVFTRDYRNIYAHRWMYERYVGPIPDGLTIDHTCHDPLTCRGGACEHRACCNPAHGTPETRGDNARRSVRWIA